MNLDKDDLLRNAVPGYIFVTVVLSYYVFISGMDPFAVKESVGLSLLTIVAGFPLGFTIQSIHRIVFHFCFG